ncbi:MAG: aldo/keto reductase [Clostridiales bacterium]|nr:aldo/keto reductase [Clostridiales bacterium]MBR5359052.1 aldo/keto reductase [Clostridiales bacterium]
MIMNETYLLSDGTSLPKIGFGTYNEAFEDNKDAILKAIECGYRFFDTASLYETERPLGAAIKESGIARSNVIIETKLWTDEMGADNARTALSKSLDRLGTDYLDIYMMHWPRQTGAEDENWKELDIETYQAMEEMVDKGLVRRLGLSNFLPHHLKNILDNCRIKPVVDQMELHPGYSQEAAVAFCKANDVLPMAWSPLGRGRENATIGNSILVRLAAKYGKSVQQINLRFLLQKGILPIPKASSMEHMKANLEVFDFELTSDDMSMLTCMPQTAWLGEHPDFVIPDRKSNPDNL